MIRITQLIRSFFHPAILLICITLPVVLFSCKNTVTGPGGSTNRYQAHSEQEFVSNSGLRAESGSVIVIELEDLNSPAGSGHHDTGTIGEDIIPYSFSETKTYNFRISDSSYFNASLVSEPSGNLIFRLTPKDNNISVTIPAGNYKLHLTSLLNYNVDTIGSQSVFIQTDKSISSQDEHLNTLISTGRCISCDLTNIDLNNSFLPYANLSHADLSNSSLSGANLKNINLNSADLSNTIFAGAMIKKGSFVSALMKGTNFNDADLDSSTFGYKTILKNVTLRNASLSSAFFDTVLLDSSDFTNADLNNASLYYAHLDHSDFAGTDFTKANLDYADLNYSDFNGAVFDSAGITNGHLRYSNFRNASFISTYLRYLNINNSSFNNSNMYVTELGYSNYDSVDFRNSRLISCYFYGADLRNVNFTNADLTDSYVYGVDFCNSILTGIIYKGIHYDNSTLCFP